MSQFTGIGIEIAIAIVTVIANLQTFHRDVCMRPDPSTEQNFALDRGRSYMYIHTCQENRSSAFAFILYTSDLANLFSPPEQNRILRPKHEAALHAMWNTMSLPPSLPPSRGEL